MRRLRSCVPLVLCLCLSALLIGCGDDETASTPTTPSTPSANPNPTPAPAPTPVPTYSVSGTISETAPTTNQRVSGVQVSIGGATATTNGNGDFTVTGVAAGSQTLTASKTDYQTQTMSVNVNSADVSGIKIALAPTPRRVEIGVDGSIAHGDASCHGTSNPCDVFPVGAHNDGNVEGFIIWKNPDVNLDLELRCNGEVIEEVFTETKGSEELHPTPVKGGQACNLNVILRGEGETLYTIYLKYPY